MMDEMKNSQVQGQELKNLLAKHAELLDKHPELSQILKSAEMTDSLVSQDYDDKAFRLPYSSNPKPIDKPWR